MDLMQYFKGFMRNYSTMMLFSEDSDKKFIDREVLFFAKLGELMGYYVFQKEQMDIDGKKRRADLIWSHYNSKDDRYYNRLHLEHEKTLSAEETINTKLANNVPALVAILWDNYEYYDHIIELCKEKITKNEYVENMLVITQKKRKAYNLMTAIEVSKNTTKFNLKLREGYTTTNNAGFYYGVLKEEIPNEKWSKVV